MEWIYAVIVLVAFLVITWVAYSSLTAQHKAEIRRLEQKIDLLYSKLEINPRPAQSSAGSLPARVREQDGTYGRIAAIKAYREETGADLATAKQAVDNMLAGTSAPEPAPARSSWDNSTWDNPPTFSPPDIPGFSPAGSKPSLSPEVRQLVRDKQKIQAIKLVRQQTGLGLKEAKDLVDAYEKELRQGY
jgi:ribosomal protein L7/L12